MSQPESSARNGEERIPVLYRDGGGDWIMLGDHGEKFEVAMSGSPLGRAMTARFGAPASETRFTQQQVHAAIDAEPELPGPMPEEMWKTIRNDKDAVEEGMRIAVRQTKSGIKDRLAAAPQTAKGGT